MTSTYEHVLMSLPKATAGVKRICTVAIASILLVAGADVSAKPARRHHRAADAAATASRPATGIGTSEKPFATADDALYRERGYGLGGVPFSLGAGDLALSGACAQVANRNPACGPAGGYGVYGNGLGYGSR